ncbi:MULTISPECIES: YhfX family PLP-dependent enzyme [unclassified Serratia (in: enterobacteria)]|uniref:YhfX family PLP-dependent enzyme n=1 Tax=unclassified Serratia (in: enterobacteria) TaxID=2647522 RepID=UPI0030764833
MFINALQKQNPKMVDVARELWAQGLILPDTYVIDVDRVISNARQLLQVAQACGIELYLMTKQIGRNPWLAERLVALGYRGVVAVDFREAQNLAAAGLPLCHVGHLVQIPDKLIPQIVAQRPEVITVFSLEKAAKIAEHAQRLGYVQPVMLKVFAPGDLLYPGQEAGFVLEQLPEVAAKIAAMPGLLLQGLTHFPCLLWDPQQQQTLPTHNLQTLLQASQWLRQCGCDIRQINAPSAASCTTLPLLAQLGATHTEPGHALTGTIPANIKGDQPEQIAMLYLTEVSHHFAGNSYCYGGGYYRRGNVLQALVGAEQEGPLLTASVLPQHESSIDYHIALQGIYPIGCPVLMCFRSQIFVTRSDVALVSGIATDRPKLEGIYDSQGRVKKGGCNG